MVLWGWWVGVGWSWVVLEGLGLVGWGWSVVVCAFRSLWVGGLGWSVVVCGREFSQWWFVLLGLALVGWAWAELFVHFGCGVGG